MFFARSTAAIVKGETMKLIQKKPSPLSQRIEDHLNYMSKLDPASEEYAVAVNQLSVLAGAKVGIEPASPPVDKAALVSAGSSLAGILLVMNFERLSIIATKAFGLITRVRI
nr:MAG TPA: hypothetical protein [Caudoviricetes sp.]